VFSLSFIPWWAGDRVRPCIDGDPVLDLQRDALREAGCERIFEEKKSGANKCRPALNTALRTLRAGDVLVVWKPDRLGRSLRQGVYPTYSV